MFAETVELFEAFHCREFSIDEEFLEALLFRPFRHVGVEAFPRFDERGEHLEIRAAGQRLSMFGHCGRGLLLHGDVALRAELCSEFREH